MPLGSALLFFAWISGLVAMVMAIRSFDELVDPAGPRRRPTIALAGGVVVSLWLPWVTSFNGQLTLSGWRALDAATVVAVVLLTAGIGTLAALPDRCGEHRDRFSLTLALSLFGIIAGNWLIGSSGGWGVNLSWGANITLLLATALAGVEAAHLKGWGPARKQAEEPEETFGFASELSRISTPHTF